MIWSTPSSRNLQVISRSAVEGGIGGGELDEEDAEADMMAQGDGGRRVSSGASSWTRKIALCCTCCYVCCPELGNNVTLLISFTSVALVIKNIKLDLPEDIMRLGLSPSFRNAARGYATRRAVKPPPKITDPLLSSPNAEVSNLPDGMTFIHRPPPTVPSPFSTTLLPASPLLRPSASTASSVPQTTDQKDVPVPPRVHKEQVFPTNRVLTEADFEKMRQLRTSNPTYYTRIRLAKQFNCPPFLVAQKVPLDTKSRKAAIEQLDAKHEEIRSKWGERKSMIMAIRKKRREYW